MTLPRKGKRQSCHDKGGDNAMNITIAKQEDKERENDYDKMRGKIVTEGVVE